MAIQIKLKNSVVQDSTPSTSDLPAVGEIALNANINSIGGFMRASDNSIVKIFGPGSLSTPTATTTVSGISELATNSETTTGTATNRVVTPAGLNAVTTAERTTSNSTYLALAGGTLTGVLAATAGSNSAPSIHFGDSDSGIYAASGGNNVRIAVGGSDAISASTAGGINFSLAAKALTSLTLGSQSATDKPLFFADANSVESASLLLDNSSNEFRVRNNRFSGKIVFAPSSNVEKARIDNAGRFLVGTSSSNNVGGFGGSALQVEGLTGGTSSLSLIRHSATNVGSAILLSKTRGTSNGATTIVQDDDVVARIVAYGADGTDTESQLGGIQFEVDGTPGANDMPGRLVFSTTADGANSSTERLRIDSSGRVGIGESASIDARLHVNSGTDNATLFIESTDGDVNLCMADNAGSCRLLQSAGDLHFRTGGNANAFGTGDSERMVIDSSGRVGIGTTSPLSKLNIFDGSDNDAILFVQGADTTSEYVSLGVQTGKAIVRGGGSGSTNTALAFEYSNAGTETEGMRIDSSGRLLIRGQATFTSTSLDHRLQVKCQNTGDGVAIIGRNGDHSAALTFFENDVSTKMGSLLANASAITVRSESLLAFETNGSNERMRITSDGKVGIGTSSPTEELTISSATPAVKLEDTDQANSYVQFSAGNGDLFLSANGASSQGQFILRSGNGGSFTERMRIDSSGNVGIGTSSPATPLHIKSDTPYIRFEDDNDNQDWTIEARAFFSIYDVTDSAHRLAIDGNGNVGIGTTSPTDLVDILNTTNNSRVLRLSHPSTPTGAAGFLGFNSDGLTDNNVVTLGVQYSSSYYNVLNLKRSTQAVGIGTVNPSTPFHVFHATTNGVATFESGDTHAVITLKDNAGQASVRAIGNALTLNTSTNVTERMRIDSSGNVGIGTSSPSQKLDVNGNALIQGTLQVNDRVQLVDSTPELLLSVPSGGLDSRILNDGSGNLIIGHGNNSDTPTERMRIDSAGRVHIGNSGLGATAEIDDLTVGNLTGGHGLTIFSNSSEGGFISFGDTSTTGTGSRAGVIRYQHSDDSMRFATDGNNERMRISSSGNVTVNNTGGLDSYRLAGAGSSLRGHLLMFDGRQANTTTQSQLQTLNRLDDDGALITFSQNGTQEGSISVSGSSVSYNGGNLSRWSQLKGISTTDKSARPTIYQGTVMSNLDDLCEWSHSEVLYKEDVFYTEEDTIPEGKSVGDIKHAKGSVLRAAYTEENQQLNMTKISDTVGDKDVAGVFWAWDDEDDEIVNDFFIAMTGDMVIRVAASTTVARGDLLISAGDGTAKPQDDDIVRSSTIAKIISTTFTETYEDGSKAYPCVLMAC